MKKRKILISGLPGAMATGVARLIAQSDKYVLMDIAFTGPEIPEETIEILGRRITLVKPKDREKYLDYLTDAIAIDYSTPAAYINNCKFFIKHNIPFIIGTTGVSQKEIRGIKQQIQKRSISAVIDQNMSVELVMISSALEYLANTFPNALTDHTGYGFESHQAGKKDKISGTLIKWRSFLESLGVNFYTTNGNRTAKYGHAYHDLHIINKSGNVRMNIKTEVEGRDTYFDGTIVALDYLVKKLEREHGKVYSMTDVLKQKA